MHGHTDSEHNADASSFATDFAVDFLQPCNHPDTLGKLDDIEILELIGRGGMGVIFKGYQRELGRYVAVKVMAPYLAASGSARKRFTREARAAAAIVHPHVMASQDYRFLSDWNNLTTPLMVLQPHLASADRWRWFDTTNWNLPVGMPALEATADDVLLRGVPLDDDGRINLLFSDSIFLDRSDAGNGTVIARTADEHLAWIAHWPAGTEFYTGSGQFAGGDRMYFIAGEYHWDPQLSGTCNLNAHGENVSSTPSII